MTFRKYQSKHFGHNSESTKALVQFVQDLGQQRISKVKPLANSDFLHHHHCKPKNMGRKCHTGLLTLSFPSVLRLSVRPVLAEWCYHHHSFHLLGLLYCWGWRALQAEVWYWILADPPDPGGYGHHSNRRHRDAHWNKENGWKRALNYLYHLWLKYSAVYNTWIKASSFGNGALCAAIRILTHRSYIKGRRAYKCTYSIIAGQPLWLVYLSW